MYILLVVFLFILIGSLFIFVLFFVSRRFSPIPYFPSNGRDINGISKLLALKNNQIVYDLGAGDGVVIFAAARASTPLPLRSRQAKGGLSPTRFVAVEINPILIIIMWLRRLVHPSRTQITLVRADIFTMTLPPTTSHLPPIFFMYISPWFMEKTILNLLRQCKSIELVTYFYAAPQSKKYRIKLIKHVKNVHDVYRYQISKTTK